MLESKRASEREREKERLHAQRLHVPQHPPHIECTRLARCSGTLATVIRDYGEHHGKHQYNNHNHINTYEDEAFPLVLRYFAP